MMKVLNFPKGEGPKTVTAPEWLRDIANKIEEEYGKGVVLQTGVVTFNAVDGSGYFYGTPYERSHVLQEIGIMEMAKNYLITGSDESEDD